MSKYQITLTPVDKFFFGGDMTFSVGAKELPKNWKEIKDEKVKAKIKGQVEENTRYSSYIIQSSMFPQQTSLLGMLRFLILRNNKEAFKDGKIIDNDKAKELIGGRSFMVNECNDFKTIKGLGHVRIRKTENGQSSDLEFAPLFKELDFEHTSMGVYNLHDTCIPLLTKDEYDAKNGIEVKLTDGKSHVKLEDDKDSVFVKDRRVGINRDIKTGEVEDGALFKQISYRFNNDTSTNYCFVFTAEIEDCIPFETYNGQIVTVGADNSQFVIGITQDVKANNGIEPYKNAIWLLSPTFLTRAEAQTAKFAITRLMPFRFLKSEMDKVKSYNVLSRDMVRSERYELYAPGSVFYFGNEDQKQKFIKLIESKEEFRQIGYNEYK